MDITVVECLGLSRLIVIKTYCVVYRLTYLTTAVGYCQIQKPVRLGELIPDPLRGPDSVSGLVFLLNRRTVYFRDFQYNVDLSEPSSGMIVFLLLLLLT